MSCRENLDNLRAEIDSINFKILDLLNERARVALQIGKCKAELGISGFDPVREGGMLKRLLEKNTGPFEGEAVSAIFKDIFQKTLDLMDKQDRSVLKFSRLAQAENTVVRVGESEFGSGKFCVIAGPCSVESEEQIEEAAASLAGLGVKIMRGGAFKPRTSPYNFQGLGLPGLKLLYEAAKRHGLAVISEITDIRLLEKIYPYVDILQIGARSMYNYDLLKEVGTQDKPVVLKRHFGASLEELLLSAEYLLNAGSRKVILCERGIRTHERWVRATLDISAVPLLKQETHLPVIADISHAAGRRDILIPLAKAVQAVGADGLMLEVHPHPDMARSDGRQQLNMLQFAELLQALKLA
ncbi:bifunctional 3-deoxy-7-phosphoheptulonate synthase/chorismate mutase [bacterium]|nr:bifunctional 3-deoxy-7-phosphoheptulonate synthase/chorismate mutase [bacterium]